MSFFSSVAQAPADPILGITEKYNADPRPNKVNLGVGVYQDDAGRVPLLRCVELAEQRLAERPKPRGYLPIDGLASYDNDVRELVFGADSPALAAGRVMTVQALGGTGALKIGADLLAVINPDAKVWISTPSWENHRALFSRAGFEVVEYRYYDRASHRVDIDGMLADLRTAEPGSIVVLHACCHNPTGFDLSHDQWEQVFEVLTERRLVPFVDLAYQGFSEGLEADSWVVRELAARAPSFLCATSFSKSFSLYGERVGALSIVCADAEEVDRVRSQLKIVIRTNYSNPPTHGAMLVATVLADDQLRQLWEEELAGMRERIKRMRRALVDGLEAAGVMDMGTIVEQVGMFSYSGLSTEQMGRLREEFAVYGTDVGRICVGALNPGNVDHVARAIAAVRQS
ncbi:MAG: aromatic amino acid transaminase [Brooklawnia sp.]|jgi:aromatic-amino-acid transaminase